MPNDVEVFIFGTEKLMAKFRQLEGFLQSPDFYGLLQDAGQAYVNLAKKAAPISASPSSTGNGKLVRGGALRSSIHHTVEQFGTPNVRVRIGAGGPGARYARYVEQGTKPSARVPVNKQWMFWMEDGAGRTVNTPWFRSKGAMADGWTAHFRKFVWHPGTRAQPFFFKQMPIVTQRFMSALTRLINQKFREQQGI